MLKFPKNQPSRIALDIVRNIIAKKGPLHTKQIWDLSQKVQPTPEEIQRDSLKPLRAPEIAQLTVPGWVPPAKPPAKAKPPPGLSKVGLKRHNKAQKDLAKAIKLDNGHPVKSISYLKQFILPLLVNLADIEKFHVKRKLNEEELAAKLLSMTPEIRIRKEKELATIEVDTWLWRLKQTNSSETLLKPKFASSKMLEELMGKNQDRSLMSKRKQRRRIEKIERDVRWAKQLSDARAYGVVEKAKEVQAAQRSENHKNKLLALEAAKSTSLAIPSSLSDDSPVPTSSS